MIQKKSDRQRNKLICQDCEHRNGKRCSVCNCFIIGLAAFGKCPENKFLKESPDG